MALFDVFKKKTTTTNKKINTHEEKVNYAYDNFGKGMVNAVFPDGCNQAGKIILSLANICDINLNDYNFTDYSQMLRIYSDTFVYLVTTDNSDELILHKLHEKHSLLQDKSILAHVLEFCTSNLDSYHFPSETAEVIDTSNQHSESVTVKTESARIKLNISSSFLEVYLESAFWAKAHMYKVAGFRQGKAPRGLIEKMYGDSIFWNDAVENSVLNEAKKKLNLLGLKSEEYPTIVLHKADRISGIEAEVDYKELYAIEPEIGVEQNKPKDIAGKNENSMIPDNSQNESYYFENPMELAIYGKLHGGDKNIIWISSDKYIELYQQGYQLFESGQYVKAINIYQECLKLNPIGISARFELVECYIATRQLNLARKNLYAMKEYLYNDNDKARFYRRVGYIAIEETSYNEAYACYKYSMNYEKHPSVIQEMLYIESKNRKVSKNISAEQILAEYGIPVL